MSTSDQRMSILAQVEAGEINVDEALSRLQEVDRPVEPPAGGEARVEKRYRYWWLIVLAVGLGVAGLGAWLATLGGWWWLCAGPLLLLGVSTSVLAVVSRNSIWVHLRVHTGQDSWPRRIAISMPLPLRISAWFLRTFGNWIPQLRRTSVDELLVALEEGVSAENPITINVAEGERGERVEVRLG